MRQTMPMSLIITTLLAACGQGPALTQQQDGDGVSKNAQALQSRPANEHNGSYVTSCQAADFNVHWNVGGRAETHRVPLLCAGLSAAQRQALADRFRLSCEAAVGPDPTCRTLAEDLATSMQNFNDAAIAALPVRVDARVRSGGWLWDLLGYYWLDGVHHLPSGAQAPLTYVLDNNDGQRGRFFTAGLALEGAGGIEDVGGCAVVAAGEIDGRIDASAGQLTARFAVNRELTCLVALSGGVGGFSAGYGFDGAVSGKR